MRRRRARTAAPFWELARFGAFPNFNQFGMPAAGPSQPMQTQAGGAVAPQNAFSFWGPGAAALEGRATGRTERLATPEYGDVVYEHFTPWGENIFYSDPTLQHQVSVPWGYYKGRVVQV